MPPLVKGPALYQHAKTRIQFGGKHAVPLFEEWPVEMRLVAHDQSPSKRGFCLATKAS